MRARLLGFLVFVVAALWRATLRIRFVGEEHRDELLRSGLPILHALWHQRMVVAILSHGRWGAVTMASRSSDGEIIATFLKLWGFKVVRGSASRGGRSALLEMIRMLRSGTRGAALTTDGPRGPARRSKSGLARLAAELRAPALPVGSSSTRPLFLKSWDRYLVPLPFSRCVVVFGEPVWPAPGESDESYLARVDAAIDRETSEADRICGVVGAPRGREEASVGGAEAADELA